MSDILPENIDNNLNDENFIEIEEPKPNKNQYQMKNESN